MWPTAEVRWFGRGEIPRQVSTWLGARGLALQPQAPRTDRYLRLPDVTGVGVKLREGRLEIKHTVGPAREVRFGPLAAGVCQSWRKWSFPVLPENLAPVPLSPSCWLPVRKERKLIYLELDISGSPKPVPSGFIPERGCMLELAALGLHGARWWTLAFEAFGDEVTVEGMLLAVTRRLLGDDAAPVSEVASSWSYPQWMDRACGLAGA